MLDHLVGNALFKNIADRGDQEISTFLSAEGWNEIVDAVDGLTKGAFVRIDRYLVINLTICIDGKLSVIEGDRISTQAEDTIMENIDMVKTVHVHYHPYQRHALA